jgi:uncharacterized membrane protein YhaH (DUF805 family)
MTEKSATQWMAEPIRKYATFEGRARRAEYWWFELFLILVSIVLAIVDMSVFGLEFLKDYGGIGPIGGLFSLAMLVPSLAVSVRRLHDKDKSGWYLLIGLIPLVGGIILLVWFCQRGTIGDNRFGPDPVG